MNKTKIKELREAQGLTQIQLAEKAGISLASLRNFEQGGQPSNRVKRSVAIALGVRLAEIGGPNVATWAGETSKEEKQIWAGVDRKEAKEKELEDEFNKKLEILYNALMTNADSQEKEFIADIDNFCAFQEILFLIKKYKIKLPKGIL
ncbi:hypothetical protein ES703_02967 [subsurface metagenome]